MQADHEMLPAGEELCGVHSVHAVLPGVGLNLPSTQAVQAPLVGGYVTGSVYPALHAQSVLDVLPVLGVLLWSGQS